MTRPWLTMIVTGLMGSGLPVVGAAQDAVTADDRCASAATRQQVLRCQRERKRDELTPYVISPAEARVLAFEDMNFPANVFERGWRQIRPVIGGLPPGSGLVGGVSYLNSLDREDLEFEVAARLSTRLFSSFDAELTLPPADRDLPVRAHVGLRASDYRGLRFFGLGPDTRSTDRATYHLQEQGLDVGVTATPGRFLELSVHGGWLGAEVDPGLFGPSIDQRFVPAAVPGFDTSTHYLRYGADIELDLRDRTVPAAGAVLRGEVEHYNDIDLDRFDFTRVAAEIQLHVPLGYRSRSLALRARTSRSAGHDGGIVPFYLMDTLGGGSTIRGFREYRFRDTRTLLLNAEYRWEVWTYLDAVLFVDGGKVFSDAADFHLEGLQTSVGFGLRGHGPAGTVLRFDVARSREAIKLHIGGGPSF